MSTTTNETRAQAQAMAVRYLDALIEHMEADETRGLPPTLAALPWSARSEILCAVEDLLFNYDDDDAFEAAHERLSKALAAAAGGE